MSLSQSSPDRLGVQLTEVASSSFSSPPSVALQTDQYPRRSWEGFGADPYLSAVAVRTTVEAFQKNNVHGHVKVRFSPSLLLRSCG
jgi:hypothetical protein